MAACSTAAGLRARGRGAEAAAAGQEPRGTVKVRDSRLRDFSTRSAALTRTEKQFVGRLDEAAQRADTRRAAADDRVDTGEALEEALISATSVGGHEPYS